jgi:hypothetical protein
VQLPVKPEGLQVYLDGLVAGFEQAGVMEKIAFEEKAATPEEAEAGRVALAAGGRADGKTKPDEGAMPYPRTWNRHDVRPHYVREKGEAQDRAGTISTEITPEEQAALDTFSGKSIETVLRELVDAMEPNEAKREVITARAAQLVIAELPDTLRGEGIDPDTWTITNATLAVKWLKIRVQDVQKSTETK